MAHVPHAVPLTFTLTLAYSEVWPNILESLLEHARVTTGERYDLVALDSSGLIYELFAGGDGEVPKVDAFPLTICTRAMCHSHIQALVNDSHTVAIAHPLSTEPSLLEQAMHFPFVWAYLGIADIVRQCALTSCIRSILTSPSSGLLRMSAINIDEYCDNGTEVLKRIDPSLLDRFVINGTEIDLVQTLIFLAGIAKSTPTWQVRTVSVCSEDAPGDHPDLVDSNMVLFEKALLLAVESLTGNPRLQSLSLTISNETTPSTLTSLACHFRKSQGLRQVKVEVNGDLISQGFLHSMCLGGYVHQANFLWCRKLVDGASTAYLNECGSQDEANILAPDLGFDLGCKVVPGKEKADSFSGSTEDNLSIFQEVHHQDQAREITPSEAKSIVRNLWAPNMEDYIRNVRHHHHGDRDVVVVFFNRYSEEFNQKLLESPLAASFSSEGVPVSDIVQPPYADGAFVLSSSITPNDIEEPRCFLEGRLGRQHVFIDRKKLKDLFEVAQSVSFNNRPKVRLLGGRRRVPTFPTRNQNIVSLQSLSMLDPAEAIFPMPADDSTSMFTCSTWFWHVQKTFIDIEDTAPRGLKRRSKSL